MYDSLWTLALALNETEREIKADGLTLTDFKYYFNNDDTVDTQAPAYNITNVLFSKMKEIDFIGTSVSYRDKLLRIVFPIACREESSLMQMELEQLSIVSCNIVSIAIFTVYISIIIGIVDGSLVQFLLGIYDYQTDGLTINYSYSAPQWNRKIENDL